MIVHNQFTRRCIDIAIQMIARQSFVSVKPELGLTLSIQKTAHHLQSRKLYDQHIRTITRQDAMQSRRSASGLSDRSPDRGLAASDPRPD